MATELSSADLLKNSAPATNLAELVDTAIKAGRLPANYTLAQAERISVVFQNTVRLHFAYQPQPWQTGPVLFVRALRRDSPEAIPPDWSPFITDLQVVDLDCTHSDLVTPALSATIAALVARHLK
jgi:thioesterase domain-containing protein